MQLRQALAELECDIEGAETRVKQAIGDATGIDSPFGKITWKCATDSKRIDWEGIAKYVALGAGVTPLALAEIAESYTRMHPGSRRFLVPRHWTTKEPES